MEKILTSIISEKFARKHCIFPVEINEKSIIVQMKKFDINLINMLKTASSRAVIVQECSEEEIIKNIEINYADDIEESNSSYEIILENIIEEAVEKNCSDIHIEPFSSELRIRYRINGDLLVVNRLSLEDYQGLSTILKLKSSCDITEKRIPQDGRFTYEKNKAKVDIRLSTIPTVFGEKIVMRLLNHNNFIKTREELGFSKRANEIIDEIIGEKCGMIVFSGTTGSGKSSSVYSLLNELNQKNINITTIEDPVEYRIDGINQIQVNNKAGVRFDNGLRAILRQDPDCVVLGEIRDVESAEIAIRAAITGHFVIATIHTNDAVSTIDRLVDMGIEPYMVNAALLGVVSQRLVKKKSIIEGSDSDERTLIYELLKIDNEIRTAIKSGKDSMEIKRIAIERGMITYEDSINEKNKG